MESIAYQELALTWEAATELESFRWVEWKKLSAEGFIRFFSLVVILSAFTAVESSLAQGFRGFPQVQGPTSFPGQTIELPPRGFFQRGDRGSAVTTIQQALRTRGYFDREPTGFYGPITENAVRRLQSDGGITVNGLVGPMTLPYLGLAPSNQAPPGPNGTLSLGDSGPEVGRVQQRLQQLRYYFGPINNFFDANTQQAVLWFQQANNITATGRVGTTTWSVLFPEDRRPPVPPSQFPLRRGSRGFSVRFLQSFLNGLGYQAGSVDGVFGSATEQAVQRLQQDFGLTANGELSQERFLAIVNYFNFPQQARTPNSLTVFQQGQSYLGGSPVGSMQSYPRASQVGLTQNYPRASQVGLTQSYPIGSQGGYRGSRSLGNNQPQMLQIQRRLYSQGLYYGPFDGVYNSQMQQAIARAQQLYGISAADTLFRP